MKTNMQNTNKYFNRITRQNSPCTMENGLSKSPIPQKTEIVNPTIKLNNENSQLREENSKLKEEKRKYLHLLISMDKDYQKKISNIQNYVKELEERVKEYQSIPQQDISQLNEMILKLTKENQELKNKLQTSCKLMEINLEREYKSTIWKELKRTPGVYYEIRIFNSRKTEMYHINDKIIQLENVIIPKVIFEDNDFKVVNRHLTVEEIDELKSGKSITLYNDGSRLTSLSGYDVMIKIIKESEIPIREKNMKAIKVKKNGKKKVKKQTKKCQSNETKDEIKDEVKDEIKQEVRKEEVINEEIKKEEIKEVKKDPLIEKQTISISIKDAYYGMNKLPITVFNKSATINTPSGIKDGETVSLNIGQNENGQDLISEITFKFDPTQYSCYSRIGNDLIANFQYSKQYSGLTINVPLFDEYLQYSIQLVDGSYTIPKYGFKNADGTCGDYHFKITLV